MRPERPGFKEVVESEVEAALKAARDVVEELIVGHRSIAAATPAAGGADNIGAAVWEISGWCLSHANALIELLRIGYAAETMGTARVFFEASELLMVFMPAGDAVRQKRWLAGYVIKHDSVGRMLEGLEKASGKSEKPPTRHVLDEAYKVMSAATHSRRDAIRDSIHDEAFDYGGSPDPSTRLVFARAGLSLISLAAFAVSRALDLSWGHTDLATTTEPLMTALETAEARLSLLAGER